MTAAEEQLVAELAEALPHQTWCNRSADVLDDDDIACATSRLITAQRLLLPVVLKHERRAVAEALREAAEEIPCGVFSSASDWLLARADAVEGGGR